ncbi:virulence protein RhuM/Fic/DOC family protein [Legionella pneumophila]|uniref:virulence protein RhuM/Fic/DOC family protein n=1 Tax=Legionella pneumophila TaxID=446 RepID=UPI0007709F6E|nr:virulence protein RhuM/Fic/DOC family protein [Legionella pneumophila]CZL70133.1 Virulence protein [Legionella pneumophila]
MAELFGTSTDNIGLHLKNIYAEGELSEKATAEDYSVVRLEGKRKVNRTVKHYNLDAIVSAGYRVNSKQGTQFRIWANKVLKEYLLQGYALNESRLIQQKEQINKLKATVMLFQKSQVEALGYSEASGLLSVLTEYTHSFALLNQYDTGNFPHGGLNEQVIDVINPHEAMQAIDHLREQLMAQGEYLYPSIEEQAAHLLYFIVKNHPFTDGNKRIGAFMFIWFLQRNKHHLKKNGEPKINDNALVAITLLVAKSEPTQKEIMVDLIINLIKEQSGA